MIEVRLTTRRMFANDKEVRAHLNILLDMGYPMSFIRDARVNKIAILDFGDSISELVIEEGN